MTTTTAPEDTVMTFSEALTWVRAGRRLCRIGWVPDGIFIFLVPGSTFKVNRAPLLGIFPEGTQINYGGHIDLYLGADADRVVTWTPQSYDLLADDWIMLPDPVD